MSLWGSIDIANNVPTFSSKLVNDGSGPTNAAANNLGLYQNQSANTVGAFGQNCVESIVAITATDIQNNTYPGAHTPGWNLKKTYIGNRAGRTTYEPICALPSMTHHILPQQARLVGLGDSIMAGSVATSFFYPAYWISGATSYVPPNGNQGVGGSTTVDLLSRNANTKGGIAQTLTLNPQAVVLHIGTNDITGLGSNATTIQTNLRSIFNQLHAGGVGWIFCDTILPRNDSTWTNGNSVAFEATRQAVNAWILQQPDIYSVNLDNIGFNPSTMTMEGLHPNRPGAWLVGNAVAQAMRPVVNTTSIEYVTSSDYGSMLTDADLAGNTGTLIGTGTTGTAPTGWNVGVNVSGMTTTSSITTKNGYNQIVVSFSGTPASNGIVVAYHDTTYSGAIGDVYDAWCDLEIVNASNTGGIFLSTDGTFMWESAIVAFGGGPTNFNGIARGTGLALATTRTSSRFQVGYELIANTPCSGTFKVSRPTWRKVPQGQ